MNLELLLAGRGHAATSMRARVAALQGRERATTSPMTSSAGPSPTEAASFGRSCKTANRRLGIGPRPARQHRCGRARIATGRDQPGADELGRRKAHVDNDRGRRIRQPATSFGLEDQVLLHLLAEQDLDIDVVTLDTGRLFAETYDVWAASERRYGRRIQAIAPRNDDLEALVKRQGINGFYQSRDARHACCYVRKIEPLNRALAGARAWVTGLRGDQSAYRKDMAVVEPDPDRGVIKVNPLIDWSREQVLAFATANEVPLNALHAKGFASIGCAPCTRAIAPGEPERAGRWWWEQEDQKECGLHTRRAG